MKGRTDNNWLRYLDGPAFAWTTGLVLRRPSLRHLGLMAAADPEATLGLAPPAAILTYEAAAWTGSLHSREKVYTEPMTLSVLCHMPVSSSYPICEGVSTAEEH